MNVIDTNVWVYSHDVRECEFMAATRKLEPFGFTHDDAWGALNDMRDIAERILLPQPEDWDAAKALEAAHSLSFWDALLLSLSRRCGVRTVFSEDMGAPRDVAGIKLVNPF